MKVTNITKLKEKYHQYDISTATENFYIRVGENTCLIHNSPSLYAGINPENGKFFVATKAILNKEPKLNYTDADIDTNHPGEGLNASLKIALKEFSNIKNWS